MSTRCSHCLHSQNPTLSQVSRGYMPKTAKDNPEKQEAAQAYKEQKGVEIEKERE